MRRTIGWGIALGICGMLLASGFVAAGGGGTIGVLRTPGSLPSEPAGPEASVSASPAEYEVTAIESGLTVGGAYGVVWSVEIVGGLSYSTTIGYLYFYVPNGSYEFTANSNDPLLSAQGGSFQVTGGPVSIYLHFLPVNFPVTFTETGLPSGTQWTVTFDSVEQNATTDSMAFEQVNGTYAYGVGVIVGYAASPIASSLSIGGGPVSVQVVFNPATPGIYILSFVGPTLPSNATWSVVVNGASQNAFGTELALREPNGSYSFTVIAPVGYRASPSTGVIGIQGAPAQQMIEFTTVPTSSGSGVSPYVYIFGSFAAVGGVIAACVGVWAWKRSRRPPQGFD